MDLLIPAVEDFEVTGRGDAAAWGGIPWLPLTQLDGALAYRTRAKLAYSSTALYVLFDCDDRTLTCTMSEDNDQLWTQDVVEAFFWPDQSRTCYFEYEISPLGVELPILIPANEEGRFFGWLPWRYSGPRKVRRATAVRGGERKPLAAVSGWSAEVAIPFALFEGLPGFVPKAGDRWKVNLYRIDHDAEPPSHWALCPGTGTSFHRIRQFGGAVFGSRVSQGR